MLQNTYKAYVCSETHWDREWYGTFQQYRIRLVKLMDKLLNLLERDETYKHFNFDGQTIVLEDYLEIRPEKREILKKHIRSGRITVGPWYILPDEFCVDGESHIRNILRGYQIAEGFGACSRTGYLPDMFGHISQMPQILRGFGIDNALLWRGLSGDEYKNELWWEAPDGSRVLVWHILEYCGYCNAALFAGSLPPSIRGDYPHGGYMLTQNPQQAVEALREIVKAAAEKAQTPVLLLFNGVDHMEPQPQLPEILRKANKTIENVEFIHARFDDFIDALKEHANESFQVVKGELKDTIWSKEGSGIVLPNVLSSRVYLKLANDRCQTILEKWAEPTSVWASMLGYDYPASLLRKAWEWLIKNHPHDSIGGCSTDAVHRQMETRFEWAQEIADAITDENLYHIANQIDTSALDDSQTALVIFNPLNWDVEDLIKVEIDLDHGWLAEQGVSVNPDNIHRTVRNLRLTDWDGNLTPFGITDVQNLTINRNHLPHFAPLQNIARVCCRIQAKVPALGYAVYRIALESKPILDFGNLVTKTNTMENDLLRVKINPNGSLNVLHKATGREYTNIGFFEDGGDNGDGYTYSPPRYDAIYNTLSEHPHISLLKNDPAATTFRVEYRWQLPESLKPNRQERSEQKDALSITSLITLGANSKRVDIETTVDNNIEDHRLRAVFPTHLDTEYCWAEGHFDVLKRPIHIEQPQREIWREDQPRQYSQQRFCDLSDGKLGLAILNRGLLEFAVGDNVERAVYLTLLRAVKWLGAGSDPNTIRGGAGPHIETPDSQCKRTLTFRYSIMPHEGTWAESDVQLQAHQHAVSSRTYVTPKHQGVLPARHSFARVDGKGIILSALKHPENGDGVIIRFWNSGDKPNRAKVSLANGIQKATLVNLLEQGQESLDVKEGSTTITADSKKIVTCLIT